MVSLEWVCNNLEWVCNNLEWVCNNRMVRHQWAINNLWCSSQAMVNNLWCSNLVTVNLWCNNLAMVNLWVECNQWEECSQWVECSSQCRVNLVRELAIAWVIIRCNGSIKILILVLWQSLVIFAIGILRLRTGTTTVTPANQTFVNNAEPQEWDDFKHSKLF